MELGPAQMAPWGACRVFYSNCDGEVIPKGEFGRMT